MMKDQNNNDFCLSRRGFGVALGASAVGLAAGGLARPALGASSDPVVEFVRTNCGEGSGPKILVGYASCCGTTGDIAEAIGKRLCAGGARVDVRPIGEVSDASGYDGFVLGSAIHAGNWMSDALKFVGKNKDLLAGKKTAYFIACMALSEDTPQSRKLGESYLKPVLRMGSKVEPVSLGKFAGAVFYDRMPKKYVAIMKKINPADQDARNWDAIKAWGDQLVPLMVKTG